MEIKRLSVYGDAMLIIKQIRGTWACKNFGLVAQMKREKQLMERFKAIELHHVARNKNQEANALASKELVKFGVKPYQFPNQSLMGASIFKMSSISWKQGKGSVLLK